MYFLVIEFTKEITQLQLCVSNFTEKLIILPLIQKENKKKFHNKPTFLFIFSTFMFLKITNLIFEKMYYFLPSLPFQKIINKNIF